MLVSQQEQVKAKQTVVTSGVFSKPHHCWAVFSRVVSHSKHSGSRQWFGGAGSGLVSRGELPAWDSPGRCQRRGTRQSAGAAAQGWQRQRHGSVIPLCQALSLKPHKLPDDENQTAPFEGSFCLSLLFISTCWGYSKHSPLQPLSQRRKDKRCRHD